jgi:hypothetical protein
VEDTRKEENNPILKALGAITATHVPADQRTPYAQPIRAANEDVFSKAEAKRLRAAGGPKIDYAVQDAAFYGPSFLPAKADKEHADLEARYKAGDEKAKEEAITLVDRASIKAGYKTGPVFHGTSLDEEINTPRGMRGVAAHVTTDRAAAWRFAEEAYNQGLGENPRLEKWLLRGDYFDPRNEAHLKRLSQTYLPHELEEYPPSKIATDWDWENLEDEGFQQRLKDAGFSGYRDREHDQRSWDDNLAVFYPEDIKSAEPFTYDKEGKLIPLSQRFNPESNDIRYLPAKKGVDAGTETDESLPTNERQTANNARAQGAGQQAGGQSQEDRNRLLSGLASVARSSQSSGTEGVQASSGTATRKEVEEAALRKHAEENGLMVDPEPFHKQWQLDGSEAGGEHQVSFPPGPDVVKRTPNPGIQKSTSLAWPLQRALPELDNLRKALSDLKPIVTYH